MIIFPPSLVELMSQPVISAFYMVRIGPSGNPDSFLETTFLGDITLKDNGVAIETYKSDGHIYRLDPPEMSSSIDRQQYKLHIADPSFIFGNNMSYQWVSSEVEIRVGFINSLDYNIIDSTGASIPPGQPLTDIKDTMVIYLGVIDSSGYQISTKEEGEVIGIITCSSPMYNLDLKRYLKLNRDNIRQKYPEDSCCDYVLTGSESVRLQWGKGGNRN